MKSTKGRPPLGSHSVFSKKSANQGPDSAPQESEPTREQPDEERLSAASPTPSKNANKRTLLAFRVSKATLTQLRFLSAELDRKQQSLFEEGLNEVFKKYGKPPIA
jgi:hypothetical protein